MEFPNVVRILEFVIDNGKWTHFVKWLILCVDIWLIGRFYPLYFYLRFFLYFFKEESWVKMYIKIALV